MSKPETRFKYRLRAFLAKGLIYLFAAPPLWFSHAVGSLIGRLGYRFGNEIRYAADINLKLCLPELDKIQHHKLLKRYLIETGKTAMESGAMWLWSNRRIMNKVRGVSGEALIEQARSAGKGVIFAMPHMGSWEIVALYCSRQYPMTTLYRPPNLPAMDTIIRQGRERFGATLVPTDNRGVKALFRALGQGETIGILPDQEPGRGQGEFAPFFGIPAYSVTLLSRLAQKTGAVVIFTYAERLPHGRGFHLHFLPAPEGIDSAELATSLAAVNLGVEQCIRRCPAQYQWGYRRFKTRPEGEAKFY
ncbi:MAG: lysophospholipid acyltransferase family protein [Gammaproteobacteria bacterium]|nr:lysophospholipid acyltransferase family protein [Gammaproteobacteria bacterium]